MDNLIETKSFHFAVRILNLCRHLQNTKKEFIISKQLARSGTSIGANITEAQQAQSRADFISKMSIALKEAVESNYWIRLLQATGYTSEQEHISILEDCKELERLLTSILNSTKSNHI